MRALSVLFVGLVLASPALAQDEPRVLLLPALGTEALRADAGNLAVATVQRALEAARLTPETPEGQVLDIVRDCPDTTVCINQLLVAAGLREACLTAVWARAGSDTPHEVLVTFADADGNQYTGRAEVEGDDVPNAARRAFARALSARLGENQVLLRLRGTPLGAAVTVDGRTVGTLPTDVRVDRGTYRITVSATGHRTQRREVTLDASEAEESFTLAEGSDPGTSRVSPLNYALGGGLLAIGAGFGAVAIVGLARDGSCTDGCAPVVRDDGVYERRFTLGPRALGYTIAAGIGVVAGVVLLAWRPFRDERLDVALQPTGLRLRGRF
ncbi:MAG: PEGA domain-containing protein [Sandaracinus sp.]|nr:PEGA domain-containing protein [Myxococcales bacterium]MCB9602894.1 PEGA domain-containing protein [Sandaracinus sp.]MCB9620548.1 PEGA domain-containing protein [Sandaracinus sp.]MCB9631385.1 PEGA domain-containing protein [Sandaracinus sp.]